MAITVTKNRIVAVYVAISLALIIGNVIQVLSIAHSHHDFWNAPPYVLIPIFLLALPFVYWLASWLARVAGQIGRTIAVHWNYQGLPAAGGGSGPPPAQPGFCTQLRRCRPIGSMALLNFRDLSMC